MQHLWEEKFTFNDIQKYEHIHIDITVSKNAISRNILKFRCDMNTT